jgi:hypothetical protein
MFIKIRKSKIARYFTFFMAINIFFEIISPSITFALTSGPSQEEFASFEPASTTDMVDVYSGDYTYNLPLLSVPGPNGGYPVNLAYHSGVSMEQEASWVGLGWSLNVGAVNRQLRGLPDDFDGEQVIKTQHIKNDWTVALDIPKRSYQEIAGMPIGGGSSNNTQVYYNNYRGIGMRYTASESYPSSGSSEPASVGLAVSIDSQQGLGIGLNFSAKGSFLKGKGSAGFDLGLNLTSRGGLESMNFGTSLNYQGVIRKSIDKGGKKSSRVLAEVPVGASSAASFASTFGVPKSNMEMKSTTVPFNLKLGRATSVFHFTARFPLMWSGYIHTSKVQNDGRDEVSAYGYMNTANNNGLDVMKDFTRKDIMYSKKIPHLGTSNFTYDLFTQSGQGTGSMFRAHLNTFGVLSDPQKISEDETINAGLEVGIPSGTPLNVHVGVDFALGSGENSSGPWTQIKDNPDIGTGLQNVKNWSTSNTNNDYEPYYFQLIGEKSGHHSDEDQLLDFEGDRAVRLKISKDKHDNGWLNRHYIAEDDLVHFEWETPTKSLDGSNQTVQKNKRIKRTTSVEALKTNDAAQYGFSKNEKYTENGVLVNKDFSRRSNHISEVSMLQPDGMRYVYGIPAYNNYQTDNCFAVNSSGSNFNTTEVPIATGSIGGIDVSGTNDEYVSKSELPAYVNSWLLTSVLSTDYLDLTGNGPSDDDYGYWVKFNYEKVSSDYKWRIPYEKANFMEGYKNDPNDDKASYTFGEKDIFILKSIETKTHLALFETSNRHDAFEAKDEYYGGLVPGAGQQTLKRLDKIKLYTKREFNNTSHTPVPTKVVNMEYSYDLCPSVLNNDGLTDTQTYMDVNGNHTSQNMNTKKGKLTLNRIFFTYQNSTRGELSPYVFKYGNINSEQENPTYNKRNMDRWGNFKNNTGSNGVYSGSGNNYPFIDNPYTDQDDEFYGTTASALKPAPWTLKEIDLPSGGIMKINYEFDDYSYVEKRRALRMFDIVGLGEDKPIDDFSNSVAGLNLPNPPTRNGSLVLAPTEATVPGSGSANDNRVWIKLERDLYDEPDLNGLTDQEKFKQLYLSSLPGNYIYFNVYSKLRDMNNNPIFDYVKGYGEIDFTDYGVDGSNTAIHGHHLYGYFTLKSVPLAKPNVTGLNVSPFTRSALDHLRANRPELMHDFLMPYSTNAIGQIVHLLTSFVGLTGELTAATVGFNNWAFSRKFGRTIQLNGYSTVRLCDPNYSKIGGGVRVQKITIDDNWKNDVTSPGSQNSIYGLEYDYTKTVADGNSFRTISSGVAYEPQVGSEECALKTPIPYSNSVPLHGTYHLFLENPIMEDYYPGPSVGYSKVTVKSIAPEQASIDDNTNTLKYSAAPITVYEFYTQKDFPVIFDQTDMNPGQPIKQPLIIPGVFSGTRRRQAKSQGYSIITNDMAGKPKSVTSLTKNGEQIISRQEYVYNTSKPYNENAINSLSSKIQTLEIDDSYHINYQTSIVGQEHDIFIDMNEDDQSSQSFGLNINFDIQYPPPIFFIMPLISINSAHNNLRTIVFNKVINRTGILKKVITTTKGSTITKDNLAFDIETGEPLITKVTNEFKDPLFNFSYPGHWYYPNMSGSYKNFNYAIDLPGTNVILSDNSGTNLKGTIDVGAYLPGGRPAKDFFAKGDLVYINCESSSNQYDGSYHIFSIDNNRLWCINSLGEFFPGNVGVESIKILKSGFKNMLTTKVGDLTFKEMSPYFVDYNPEDDANTNKPLTTITIDDVSNKITNASAVEYSNDWQVILGGRRPPESSCTCVLNQSAYDFMNMFQSLSASGDLYMKNMTICDLSSNTYSHGFTSSFLNASSRLVAIKNYMLSFSFPAKFWYSGELQPNGDLWMYFHGSTIAWTANHSMELNATGENCCKIILTANGINWQDIATIGAISPATPLANCSVPNDFNVNVTTNSSITKPISVSVTTPCNGHPGACIGNCWEFYQGCNAVITPNYVCGITEGDPINPYLAGMKGMWRPKATYAYNTSRDQNNNIRVDGTYNDFDRFRWENVDAKSQKWITAGTVTKYSPFGYELESLDALNNYSSALYGYQHSLMTARAVNSKYTEIAFDNFEDYPVDCNDNHFKFSNYASSIKPDYAHTGKYSIQVLPGVAALIQKPMDNGCSFTAINDVNNTTVSPYTPIVQIPHGTSSPVDHIVNSCDGIGEFNPIPFKKYVASVWVREVENNNLPLRGAYNYIAPQLKVTILVSSGSPVIYNFTTKGNVIDGWQRVFEEFFIPANATDIKVELVNQSTVSHIVYFDDIRIHPFDGNMSSYVYDPLSLKILAELDANNYATIYTYDDEGHLNRVKKETLEGIKTIKEGRINTKKVNE